jgi:hypothetical protein
MLPQDFLKLLEVEGLVESDPKLIARRIWYVLNLLDTIKKSQLNEPTFQVTDQHSSTSPISRLKKSLFKNRALFHLRLSQGFTLCAVFTWIL